MYRDSPYPLPERAAAARAQGRRGTDVLLKPVPDGSRGI